MLRRKISVRNMKNWGEHSRCSTKFSFPTQSTIYHRSHKLHYQISITSSLKILSNSLLWRFKIFLVSGISSNVPCAKSQGKYLHQKLLLKFITEAMSCYNKISITTSSKILSKSLFWWLETFLVCRISSRVSCPQLQRDGEYRTEEDDRVKSFLY